MANLYVDPLYLKLCRFQVCFRARLTPKPWRVDDEYEERFVYDRMTGLVLPHASPYAVCHLIEVIGNSEIAHATSRGRSWRIVRIAYRWEWVVHAILQIEGSAYKWQVWQNGNLDHPIAPYWSAEYGGEYWKNLGDTEQFVVWINEL